MAATLPLPDPKHPLDIEISNVHRLADYQPPEWGIERVDLMFDIVDETRVGVSAVMRVKRAKVEGNGVEVGEERPLLVLNKGPNPVVHRVTINGEEIPAEQIFVGANAVVIRPDSDEFTLTTEVTLDPSTNKSNQGLFITSGIMVSQCEATSFSDITPFVDRPDMMTHWTTTVTAPRADYPVTLSNGNTIGEKIAPESTTRTFENPFKMPSYLFALVAGDLKKIEETHITKSGKTVKLEIYAAEGFIEGCDLAMAALKKALQWEEERWGVECDLEEYKIVVIEDLNAGAMENKGLNVFSAAAASGTQRNRNDAALLNIANVIAHELGHNVRGNRVSIRSFHEIALKEGFTRLTDQMFMEDTLGPVMRVKNVRGLRGRQFPEDTSANAHPILQREYSGDPMLAQMYNATAYEKGAEVIRMVHTILGKKAFRQGFENYLQKFDGKAATLYDLIRALAEPSGTDVTQFERWLNQVGTPEVTIEKSYDETTRTLTVTFEQTCPKPPHDELVMPCAFALFGPDGQPVELEDGTKEGILLLSKKHETFQFKNVPLGTVPSFFRRFSAPVRVKSGETTEDRRHLMKYETDAVSKTDAYEAVIKQGIKEMVEQYQKGERRVIVPNEEVMEALSYVLEHAEDDLALAALMLEPPEIMDLVQEGETYDFEATCAALDSFKKAVAQRFEQALVDLYKKYKSSGQKEIFADGEFHPEVAHERSIKNRALSYLAMLGGAHTQLVRDQFDNATNMSDEQTALFALANMDETRDQALEQFYQKWKEDPLALEIWMKATGIAEAQDSVERVRKVTESDRFTLGKPKHVFCLLVRGLIDNYRYAHEIVTNSEGEETAPAYTLIADMAIKCPNEYWGTRLVKELFSMLPKMDKKRQTLMRKELERIVATPNIKEEVQKQARRILG